MLRWWLGGWRVAVRAAGVRISEAQKGKYPFLALFQSQWVPAVSSVDLFIPSRSVCVCVKCFCWRKALRRPGRFAYTPFFPFQAEAHPHARLAPCPGSGKLQSRHGPHQDSQDVKVVTTLTCRIGPTGIDSPAPAAVSMLWLSLLVMGRLSVQILRHRPKNWCSKH